MSFTIREAAAADRDEALALLPRLGAFPLPDHRRAREIFAGDERVLHDYFDGQAEDCRLWLACAESPHRLVGFALVRLRPDVFNGTPSAHLEALAVSEGWEGKGVASSLIRCSEESASREGALTMSLHVFETNERARSLYERLGYASEWIRYIKPLGRDGKGE